MVADVALDHLELEVRVAGRVCDEAEAGADRLGRLLEREVLAGHVVLEAQSRTPLDEALVSRAYPHVCLQVLEQPQALVWRFVELLSRSYLLRLLEVQSEALLGAVSRLGDERGVCLDQVEPDEVAVGETLFLSASERVELFEGELVLLVDAEVHLELPEPCVPS